MLQKLHLQLHFKSVRNLNCNHFGADSKQANLITPKRSVGGHLTRILAEKFF